jgi:hypothetical protein
VTCPESIDLFAPYLAHDLAPEAMEAFLAHVRGCPRCHEKLLALETYLALAGDPRPDPEQAGRAEEV